ncbi:hypothetical protein DFH09DRAFT_1348039 [Mycena vulgaris]|nr:hypothetical protein DFH09DRAFT_1348039 [Mycena vulgaris]
MDLGLTESPPPPRTTILGSFLGRGRPRNSSQSHIDVTAARELQPPPPPAPPSAVITATPSSQPGLTLSHMLRRRRSAGNVAAPLAAPAPPTPTPLPSATAPLPPTAGVSIGPTHRIRLVPHLDSRRSLRFDPISRDLRVDAPPLRIGRFTDRSGLGLAAVNALSTNKIAFKSKVVSRESGSSPPPTQSNSGTFLNHVRLSPANTESRAHQIKDGDILQLGVDYLGGAEDIYKSVKIRVEVGREWQGAANAFNTNTLRNLKTLAIAARGPGRAWEGDGAGEAQAVLAAREREHPRLLYLPGFDSPRPSSPNFL